jgi:hypothetical protein
LEFFCKSSTIASTAVTLAGFTPVSAQTVIAYPQFGGTPVQLDAYNASLAVVSAPSNTECRLWRSCVDTLDQIDIVYQRFNSPPVYVDAYNETLTTAALTVTEAAVVDPKMSYALAPGFIGPGAWEEGPISPESPER